MCLALLSPTGTGFHFYLQLHIIPDPDLEDPRLSPFLTTYAGNADGPPTLCLEDKLPSPTHNWWPL